jgi:hypothetical protein
VKRSEDLDFLVFTSDEKMLIKPKDFHTTQDENMFNCC